MIGLGLPPMSWKSYVLVSGAGLIGTYFLSTPATPEPGAPVSRRVVAEQVRAAGDIQELAVRLQARVRAEVAFREPARNPFRFSPRPTPREAAPASVVAAPAAAVAPAPPALPFLALIGVAADDVEGVTQRTAIISTGQSVLLVRDGDAVGAGYTVRRVEEGAVDLTSTADGSGRRLTFTP